MEQLIQLLLSVSPLSSPLIDRLRKIIRLIEYKKGDIILAEGQVCNLIAFIESGLIRSYYKIGEKEVSNWFMGKGDIFISVLSFHRRTASLDSHVAMMASRCWGIFHAELEETYILFPEFERHGRLLEAEYYCRAEERQIMLKRQTPDEKYKKLMVQYPDLIRHATNEQLASFLDVGERTFNRMKQSYNGTPKKKTIVGS